MIQSDGYMEATQSQMKLAISEWEELMIITGGYMEPDKSVQYLLDYEWIQRKWKCKNLVQDKILEADNKTIQIPQYVILRLMKQCSCW